MIIKTTKCDRLMSDITKVYHKTCILRLIVLFGLIILPFTSINAQFPRFGSRRSSSNKPMINRYCQSYSHKQSSTTNYSTQSVGDIYESIIKHSKRFGNMNWLDYNSKYLYQQYYNEFLNIINRADIDYNEGMNIDEYMKELRCLRTACLEEVNFILDDYVPALRFNDAWWERVKKDFTSAGKLSEKQTHCYA